MANPIPVNDTTAIRDRIVDHCNLHEILGENGDPFITLKLKFPPYVKAGFLRLWGAPETSAIDRVLHLYVGGPGNDANVMYAMTKTKSAVPHFMLQFNVNPPGLWSYHVDLTPKVDSVMYPAYWQEIYTPLSVLTENEPLKSTMTHRIQADRNVYLSTWGLHGKQVALSEYQLMQETVVPAYLQRFLAVHDHLHFDDVPEADIVKRGQRQEAMFFAREMDERGWERLDEFFGVAVTEQVRAAFAQQLAV